ncbi:MAG: sterol desaturase family protein [Pseudomonadales bacterium]
MTPFDDQITSLLRDDLSLLALPLFALAIALEAWHSHRHRLRRYQASDTVASLSMLLASAIVEVLPKLVAVTAMVVLHEISPLRDLVGRQWWAWLLLFFLEDVSYYWFHRANHSMRLLWAGHVNHHSSRYLNFGTALRQGVGERVHKYLFWLWLPLLGFDALMIVTMMALSLFYQFWIHTELVSTLPKPLEWLFNTPSHHRVHHASNIRYLDRNHGGVLILWDRLFGTFSPELPSDPCCYGLTHNISSSNPWTVLSHEYQSLWHDLRRAPRLVDRLRYLYLAPGWHHDGDDHRSAVLRAAAQNSTTSSKPGAAPTVKDKSSPNSPSR